MHDVSCLRRSPRGFTLIEVMITVAIIGILAAVAYPAYTEQLRKGRRAECRAGLFQAMQQQERFFTQYNAYATFSEPPASSAIKNFSGDNSTNSACLIKTIASASAPNAACTNAGVGCTTLSARQVKDATDPVSTMTLDSLGNKGCVYNGTTYGVAGSGQKDCWP